ncbi:TolC family protein [Variovorax saccharolyticus]|uniref:TolC family protein n=1 Tax=Variovorax saccharolyticus TaxID=3053516 RepID=UPI00257639D2|nr:TolC family protein [Variovorax sp. J31P216]MDM0025434.1 TolC family protein [Variovorax sp. J31P216]
MRTPSLHRGMLVAALAAAVAGCALKSPPTPAELQKEVLPQAPPPEAYRAGGSVAAPVADGWLAAFEDPALTALVNEALAYNADLRVAAARVEQAAGYVKVASGALLPSVGVVGLGGGKSGGGGGLEGVFLNASLELDVWGRLRYGREASREQSAAVEADYAYARQSLAAMVVKAWFLAVQAGMQRVIAQDALGSSETLLRMADDRFRVGNGSAQAVAQARASVGPYRDTLKQIDFAREQARRSLELLLGRYPAAEIAVADRLPPMPPPLPVGMPSELLERRPDVVAAERRVAAAFARVGEAKAAQLPRISLTAGGSNVSSDLIELKDVSSPVWSLGVNLIAPIYQGGALRAQVEIRSAEQKQAVAEYARVGQKAFGEVENALGAESILRERDAILVAAVRDNAEALDLARVQYRVGNVDLRTVEQSQLSLYAVRTSRLQVQAEQLAQRTNLFLALGGGFDQPAMAAVAGNASEPLQPKQ